MYSPSHATLKKNPSWCVGTGQRQPLQGTTLTPGPGNYIIQPKITEGPKYVMGLKGQDQNKSKLYVPGPGAYAPDFS